MKAVISNNVNYKKQLSAVFVKFAVCFLLMGLAYRLFFSTFVQFSHVEVSNTAFVPEKTLPKSSNLTMDRSSQNGKCDLYIGEWVPDPTGPFYTNRTCYSIEAHQNCMRNGRPDTNYLYWRWKPRDCELPKFNPKRFLDMMRHKSLAFIGDSIMRNHVQSLLCILSQIRSLALPWHISKPSHFSYWLTAFISNVTLKGTNEEMREIELDAFERALRISSEVGLTLKLFDTTFLSLLRPDGHPGVYRQFQPFAGKNRQTKVQNDCLHWCLPGPIDSWNDLMMETLVSS